MEIEKAIKRCENIRDGAQVVLDSGFGTHESESPLVYKNRVEFANTCLSALRAQQEREKGCELCTLPNGDKVKHLILAETCGEAVFCPVCGRRLKEAQEDGD